MGESLDERELSAADLWIRLLEAPMRQRSFDCGEKALGEFLNTGEALEFQRKGLGKTHLAFHGEDLVGYLTVSLAEVRIEYLTSWAPAAQMVAKGMEAIPALKVGRLAVAARFQGRGGVVMRRPRCAKRPATSGLASRPSPRNLAHPKTRAFERSKFIGDGHPVVGGPSGCQQGGHRFQLCLRNLFVETLAQVLHSEGPLPASQRRTSHVLPQREAFSRLLHLRDLGL